jgi:hypothetical protein
MSTPGELLEALGREARARFGNGRDATTRVYRGRSVDELVPQIQRDLGADAIIVRRREGLTGGVLGFFQRAFVEIEAMPGSPGVDVYDEPASPPAPAQSPVRPQAAASPRGAPARESAPALDRSAAGYPPVTSPQPDVSPQPGVLPQPALAPRPSYAPPAPIAGPPTSPQHEPYSPAAPEPPAPAPEPQRPALAPAPQRPPSAPAPSSALPPSFVPPPSSAPPLPPTPHVSAPAPFYAREPSAPPAGAGSAYVTAHLAALARADRSKVPPRAPTPARGEEPPAWGADFQELIPREAPEPFAAAPALERPAARRRTDGERRVVAPGSHARASAGVVRSLRRCGIGEELARELIDSAGAHALALAPRAGLAQAVRATLAQRIPVAPPLPTKGAAIVIVGAGGSGKTTCCAALLGAYRKSSSLPASCATITRDPERGELRMILSPYVMKPSPARAPRALRAVRRARGDGMAVIDTPSLSPSDRAGIRELAALLAELEPERVVVALPATLGATAAAQLLQALRPLGANSLAVTHADETDQIGVAVEAACSFGLAPEYMLERARAGGWRVRQIGPTALAERLLP